MPLFLVDSQNQRLTKQQPVPFEAEGWQERRDLQPLLRENAEQVFGEDLMIIAAEFSDWQESSRRIDLLGLDREGNLVVIELKRGEEGAHMELQALRYAAMVSAMDFEWVVSTYESFLRGQNKPSDVARQELQQFLEKAGGQISSVPRIILVAPSFSREITATVLWLNEQGLQIKCAAANLYTLDGRQYLDIEQVIPLPSAEEYLVHRRQKGISERQPRPGRGIEDLCKLAEGNGIGEQFRALLDGATQCGLHAYPYRGQIVYFTPREGSKEGVLCVSPAPRVSGRVHVWISPKRFEEHYDGGIREEDAAEILGTREQGGILGRMRGIWSESDISANEVGEFLKRLQLLVDRAYNAGPEFRPSEPVATSPDAPAGSE